MADINQMQARIRELEARRAKGESVPELDRLYEKMDSMQNKGYEETKKNLSGENLVKPKSKQQKHTEALAADQAQGAAARGMTVKDFVRSQTKKANKVLTLEEDTDSGYKKGGKVSSASKRADGCATKGKTRGKML